MRERKTDNKIPIYELKSKKKILNFYVDWTKKAKFNQDMIDWNYQGPKNVVKLLDKHTSNKNINILDAGCGSGKFSVALKKFEIKL